MANAKANKNSAYLFMALLGAVLFNLSAWPGGEALGVQSTDHASLSGCDLKRQLENPDIQEAGCEVKNGQVEGRIRVSQEERRVRDLSPNGEGNIRTVREWKITYDLTGNCKDCGNGQKTSISETEYFSDISNVDRIASDGFDKHSKRLSGELSKVREDVRREEICLAPQGEERSSNEVMKCRIEKLNAMSGEKAAQYYQEHIENDVQALVESDRASDRQRGKSLLGQLARNQNSYVRESTMDLAMYADYREQVNVIRSQLEAFRNQPQDPRARLLAQQLNGLKTQWGGYFTNRFGRESMMYDSSLGDFTASTALTNSLTEYDQSFKTSVDQVFASIPSLHQQYLNNSGVPGNQGMGGNMNVQPAGTGRNAMGWGYDRYQGAPGTPSTGYGAGGGMMPQQQMQGPGGYAPQMGGQGGYMPQNSRMPMPGSPVYGQGPGARR